MIMMQRYNDQLWMIIIWAKINDRFDVMYLPEHDLFEFNDED